MQDKKASKKPKNSLKTAAQLSGIAFQMGATIFAGAYFGKYLDQKYPSDKSWFTMIFSIIAVVISLYMVLRQINKLNEQDNK